MTCNLRKVSQKPTLKYLACLWDQTNISFVRKGDCVLDLIVKIEVSIDSSLTLGGFWIKIYLKKLP